MAKIKVGEHEFNMRFTLGFWDRIKCECNVTQLNMEQRLNEDFGNVAANIVYWGIYYGYPLVSRPRSTEEMPLDLEMLKSELDASVAEIIEETIIEGMTKIQKELVGKARELQKRKLEELGNEEDKKKLS